MDFGGIWGDFGGTLTDPKMVNCKVPAFRFLNALLRLLGHASYNGLRGTGVAFSEYATIHLGVTDGTSPHVDCR